MDNRYTDEILRKLQNTQLEMLRTFNEICKRHNITYFVTWGTALGAIRHNGFIPWDDDIDVGLPREDYEKFIVVAQKYLPNYYFIQNIYTDPNYPNTFAKIRDSRTTFIEKSSQNIRMNHGVYIDVFPLDGIPSSSVAFNILWFKKRLLNKRIGQIFISESRNNNLVYKFISVLLKIMYPNYKAAIRKRESLYRKYKYQDCEYVTNHGGAWGKKENMLKSCFGKGTVGEFEGLKVILPEDYDRYLTNVYGDYMTLPPVEKRVGHHYCTVIDFEKSYTEYVGE